MAMTAAMDSHAEVNSILDDWRQGLDRDGEIVPRLNRLCELFEKETEAYFKIDPDPMDDRHPGRASPQCVLGQLMKTLFRQEELMTKVVNEYLMGGRTAEQTALHTAACRLLLDVLPGLETSVVFQETVGVEGLVARLLTWAREAEEPLRSYATGLLGGAMEIQDVAHSHKDANVELVPIMLARLHELQAIQQDEEQQRSKPPDTDVRHFAVVGARRLSASGSGTARSEASGSVAASTTPAGAESADKKDVKGATPNSADKHKKGSTTNSANKELKGTTSKGAASKSADKDGKGAASNSADKDIKGASSKSADKDVKGATSNSADKDKKGSTSTSAERKPSAAKTLFSEMEASTTPSPATAPSSSSAASGALTPSLLSSSALTSSLSSSSAAPPAALTPSLSSPSAPPTVSTLSNSSAPGVSCSRSGGASPGRALEGAGSYRSSLKRSLSPGHSSEFTSSKRSRTRHEYGGVLDPDTSNSSWKEMAPFVIGSYSLKHPLSVSMKARLVLQYLATMGDYQELLSCVFEGRALDLIFFYIDLTKNNDVRLAFEALKYLATLLCHKKFTIEFLQREGVQRLLRIYRPSIAATGVALCLYYLSYFEDAMERVCLLPDHVLSDLVGYVLWLMECSHDSSRCHACMFFSQVFPFRVMLDLFDQRDGLRRLFNTISTLEILNVDSPAADLGDDQVFAMRQAARHVCGALKKYFEAHLVVKAEEVRRSHSRSDGTSPLHETPAYKPMKLVAPVVQEHIELLMELLPVRAQWTPEVTFHKLTGLTLLVQLIAMAPGWGNYPGKPETIRSALDVLHVLTVTPKSQILLLNNVKLENNVTSPTMSVLTGLAEGEVLSDADVQKGALNIIINCVCGPSERLGGGVGRYMGSGSKRKVNVRAGEDVLSRLWSRVQTNNGIMVLLKLLSVKTPITEADSIRSLACRALVGLCRSETVKQILEKLPVFNNGQLQNLMKEPVLQDKRQEHVKFCKHASHLLERVSGKQSNTLDASLEDIRRADIVAQTQIMYREKELMQLIHDHLASKGLTDTASVLQREAGLPRCSTPPPPHPASAHIFSPATPKLTRQLSQPTPGHSVSTPVLGSAAPPPGATPTGVNHVDHHASPSTSTVAPSPGPLRFTLHRNTVTASPREHKPSSSRSRFLREGGYGSSHRGRASTASAKGGGGEFNRSLDNIVTEYLRKQHALCRNPVSTCPPMSLFEPHRCPEPQGRFRAPVSITSRLMNRAILPPFGGADGAKLNRKLFFSRFQVYQTYRDKDDDSFASCCFSDEEDYLMLGTYSGDIKLINIHQWEESTTLHCHNAPVIKMQPGHGGKLLLTSSWGVSQESALWNYGSTMEIKHRFDDHLTEFSKLTQDRIVGTNNETANIYDVVTGVKVMSLFDDDMTNNYKANMATFSPTDDLVLNDGVLWDVRSRRPLHKFDKFNQFISGVFHPQGREIIINSEVWDQRTYKLLHTVPALDQCQIKFNHHGDVIFAIRVDDELDSMEDSHKAHFSSTLRTFDATDYSSIGTLDLKTRSIFDLCSDRRDTLLAVVEQNTQFTENGAEESICRLYQMQKLRDEEDNEQEEEEEGEEAAEDEDDDDDDDDDPSSLLFGSSESEGNEDDDDDNIAGDNNDENNEENVDDDDDDDYEPLVMEFSPSNSDDDNDDNDNDDLDDDMLFALV